MGLVYFSNRFMANAIPMRVLIRDLQTGDYFQSPDQWTAQRERARDFGQSVKAAAFASQQHLHHIEIVLSFADPKLDVRLPLRD